MRQFVKTAVVYAVVTPPLAAVTAVLVVSLYSIVSEAQVSPQQGTAALLVMLPISALFSYGLGGVQGLFVGIGAALWQRYRGTSPIAVPLVLSFVAWVGFSAQTSLPSGTGQDWESTVFSSNGMLWLALHLFAGAVGWRLAKS
jgi:hypothetical protein